MPRASAYPETHRTRNYLAGLATSQITRLAVVLVGLWMTPFILQFVDAERYGLFALAMSVPAWLSVLDVGTAAALQARLSRVSGRADQHEVSRHASSGFWIQIALALLVLAVGLSGAKVFPRFFGIEAELTAEAVSLVVLLVVATALTLAAKTFSTILIAYQRMHIQNLIRLLRLSLRTGLAVLLLLRGWGIVALAAAYLVACAAAAVLTAFGVYRFLPGISIRPGLVSRRALQRVGTTGLWFSLGGLAGLLIVGLDRAVAAKMISLEAVTVLFLTHRLYALASTALSPIVDTARPGFGQLLGEGRTIKARGLHQRLLTASSCVGLVAGFAIWSGNEAFVRAWVGPENYGGWMLDATLAGSLVLHMWILPHRATLAAGLVVKPQTLCRLCEAALNLVLSIWLTWKFGLVGVSLSTTLAAAVTSCWYLPRLVSRMFKPAETASLSPALGRLLALPLLLLPVACGARAAARQWDGYGGAAIALGATALWGGVVVWFLVFNRKLRAEAAAVLPRLVGAESH